MIVPALADPLKNGSFRNGQHGCNTTQAPRSKQRRQRRPTSPEVTSSPFRHKPQSSKVRNRTRRSGYRQFVTGKQETRCKRPGNAWGKGRAPAGEAAGVIGDVTPDAVRGNEGPCIATPCPLRRLTTWKRGIRDERPWGGKTDSPSPPFQREEEGAKDPSSVPVALLDDNVEIANSGGMDEEAPGEDKKGDGGQLWAAYGPSPPRLPLWASQRLRLP